MVYSFDWETATSYDMERALKDQADAPWTPVWISNLIKSRFGQDVVDTANWLEELNTSYRYLADAVNSEAESIWKLQHGSRS